MKKQHEMTAATLLTSIFLLFSAAAPIRPAGAFDAREAGEIREGLRAPTSIDVSGDRIALLEPFFGRILVYTPSGRIDRRVDFRGDAVSLARITGAEYLFCDRKSGAVRLINVDTGAQRVFFDGGAAGIDPVDLIVRDGECLILDGSGRAIVTTDRSGAVTGTMIPELPSGVMPGAVTSFAFDPARDRFLLFDQVNSRLLLFRSDGRYEGTFCSFGAADGTVSRGGEIACDEDGFVYVADRFQGRIAVFDRAGRFAGNIGGAASGGARFANPAGVALDRNLLYVVSTESGSVGIFSVRKDAAEGAASAASTVAPVSNDTVDVATVEFVARLDVPVDRVAASLVDIEIASAADSATIVSGAVGLALAEIAGDGGGGDVLIRWTPDTPLTGGMPYTWRVRVGMEEEPGEWSKRERFHAGSLWREYILEQNIPNPFNPVTTISFILPETADASLVIYNLSGREIWSRSFGAMSPGPHQVEWNGTDADGNHVASGVYFFRLTAGEFSRARKMVLAR